MPAESATPTRATAAWRALMGPVSPAQGGATVAIAAAAAVGIGASTRRRVGWRTGLLTAVVALDLVGGLISFQLPPTRAAYAQHSPQQRLGFVALHLQPFVLPLTRQGEQVAGGHSLWIGAGRDCRPRAGGFATAKASAGRQRVGCGVRGGRLRHGRITAALVRPGLPGQAHRRARRYRRPAGVQLSQDAARSRARSVSITSAAIEGWLGSIAASEAPATTESRA